MKLLLLVPAMTILFFSCSKPSLPDFRVPAIDWSDSYRVGYGGPDSTLVKPRIPSSNRILVDASRDGGIWWFPQTSNYDIAAAHQGFTLATYLRSLGYTVDEIIPGTRITDALLHQYTHVIRAGAFTDYSNEELTAYQNFLSRPSTLLLFQDHLQNSSNDALSSFLHLNLEGSYTGLVSAGPYNSITSYGALNNFEYVAGSFLPGGSHNGAIYSLATIPGTDSTVMGIVKSQTSRIFFIGDINGLETYPTPQPLARNLFNWLYE